MAAVAPAVLMRTKRAPIVTGDRGALEDAMSTDTQSVPTTTTNTVTLAEIQRAMRAARHCNGRHVAIKLARNGGVMLVCQRCGRPIA